VERTPLRRGSWLVKHRDNFTFTFHVNRRSGKPSRDLLRLLVVAFLSLSRWLKCNGLYEGVSKSFRSGSLERELQMVQLSATRCSCIAILWVSLLSFAVIILCVASQWVYCCCLFRYRLSPETFGYTLVNYWIILRLFNDAVSTTEVIKRWKETGVLSWIIGATGVKDLEGNRGSFDGTIWSVTCKTTTDILSIFKIEWLLYFRHH
jgi:hypothetical protein